MTLIEFFTASHIDNISACLRLQPEKLIMVGNTEEMKEPLLRYKQLLKQRTQRTEVSACNVRGKDFGDLCAVLDRLIHANGECVIDLTGGDDSVVMAMGAVYAALDPDARKQVRVERYDRKTETVLDCIHDNRKLPCKPVNLTVEEMLLLQGGGLYPYSEQPPQEFTVQDLEKLWKLVAKDPKGWNDDIKALTEYERRAKGGDKMHVVVELATCDIKDPEKEKKVRKLLNSLRLCGVITNRSDEEKLDYTYCSPVMRLCTQKAGNVLELKTLLEARAMTENGVPFFHDARMSVNIDWDGVYYDPEDRKRETRNEIDVVLMHGTVPIFISCKNGNIGDEELYKLNTVASRFGGPYAGKMLVAAKLDQKSDAANDSFAQRAWDMDILLVKDGAKLTSEQWQKCFKSAML